MTGRNSLTRRQEWALVLALWLPHPWCCRTSERLLRRWGYL